MQDQIANPAEETASSASASSPATICRRKRGGFIGGYVTTRLKRKFKSIARQQGLNENELLVKILSEGVSHPPAKIPPQMSGAVCYGPKKG